MTEELQRRCELFIANRDKVKQNLKWENSLMYPLCSSIYTAKNMEVDAEKIKNCKNIIKQHVGIFSNFRGVSLIALSTMLSLEEMPEAKFTEALKIYDLLKKEFFSSYYLPVVAFIIAQMAEPESYESITKKTKSIYKLMKSEHPFLTTSEDCTFAALFALSELSEEVAVREMEQCYQLLHGNFFSSNAVQSLSHALALGEESAQIKCKRTMDIFNGLKSRGCKYGTSYELATLGVIALASDNIDQIVNDIIEVNLYLKNQKGFGVFSIGEKQRIMYAGMLVSSEYTSNVANNNMNTAALNSVTSLIIAEQAAVIAAISASSAAAASTSGS